WVLSLGCRPEDTHRTAWLCWHGRSQRLWLVPAKIHGMSVDGHRKGLDDDLETAPDGGGDLTGGRRGGGLASAGEADWLRDEGLTRWRLLRGRWCLPLSVRDEDGKDLACRERPLAAGRPWSLSTYARCEGEVRVRAWWSGDEGRRAGLCV